MNTRTRRLALLGLALGVLLALLLAPQTRWLVRLQVLVSAGQYHLPAASGCPYTHSVQEDDRRRQAVAARIPNDYAIQYAAAGGNTHAEALENLRALTARFPDQPPLYANLLRYEALANLHFVRPEPGRLLGTDLQKGYRPTPPTPQQLATFDAEAAAGERVDPDNAYFPLMRAVGLFAACRDAEAVAAFRRAGGETAWREYLADDVQSRWRLHQAAFGDDSLFAHGAVAWNTWLPQYQGISQAARIVVYKAMRAEQAGHPQEGLALRDSVRRVGDLMRVQSSFLIGSVIGVNLCVTSCYRPGGAPLPHFPPGGPDAATGPNSATVAAAYAVWARRLGRPDVAQAAVTETEAGRLVLHLTQTDQAANDNVQALTRLSRWWAADLALLANVFWVLLLGASAALAPRYFVSRLRLSDWRSAMRRILTAVALALWGLILLVFLWNALNWILIGGPGALWRVVLAVAAALAGAVWITRRVLADFPKAEGRAVVQTLGAILCLGIGLYAFCVLLDGQTRGLREAWAVPALFTQDGDGSQAVTPAAQWASRGAALTVPLLMAVGLFLARRLRRLPSGGWLVGFRDLACTMASLLLLVYGALAVWTIRQEGVQTARLQQEVVASGPYYAALAGQPWPGPVR